MPECTGLSQADIQCFSCAGIILHRRALVADVRVSMLFVRAFCLEVVLVAVLEVHDGEQAITCSSLSESLTARFVFTLGGGLVVG
jgi:hypothetical protein